MRAAVTTAAGPLQLVDLDVVALRADEVRVRVSYCGICGSDLHWHRHFPDGTVMGHEVVGVVSETGAAVSGWSVGQRVCIFPAQACGDCVACNAGRSNICSKRVYGVGGPRNRGGYADSVIVLASMLVRIPGELSDRAAAIVEPLTVGIHGVAVAALDSTQPVAVIGTGTIGLMTLLALRAKGFQRLLAIEVNPQRRALVERLGIPAIGTEQLTTAAVEKLGAPPQAIFECAGHPTALTLAIGLLGPGGRIVLMSNPAEAVPLPQSELMLKEAQIISAIFYLREEFEQAIDWLASGKVPADAIPLSIFPLEQAGIAFAELLQKNTPHMKVLLQPDSAQ
ncbi:putative Theronine dehydrogenase-like Zn-dependent dehydrogenase [Pseudomonas sp. 9AZ]|uniref:zinc-dependent alcohol dehydrogenase n=1 Tax=Pseudomonas sp. 9AZ TaxID=2653168 RepID=UPI0012F34367|nr:alcohol dehydrogenase catalytic domain-containing protein [Pseudomonas sp. 9AZ]VXD04463.1 putative Theronine dehydrogenase-like Zn-dependent dehydrogenase [Pseudomonas sp. 9AZ]